MSELSQTLPSEARKERRRLHLREVQEQPAEAAPQPQPEAQPEPERETVGALLRRTRIARGEDSAAVAGLLKMRRDQLDAVEHGDLERLPGRTYAVGFVRAYARHLGLDADALVQQFKDETAGSDVAKPVDLVFPKAREQYRAPGGSIVVPALAIALVVYGISYVTMPGKKQVTTAQAEEAAVIVEAPKAAPPPVAAPQPAVPADSQSAPVEVAVGFVAGSTAIPEQSVPLPAPVKVAEAPQPVLESMPPSAAEPASRINLKAIEPTYIQIRDPKLPRSRAILIARVLNVGESYSPPERPGLVMQTGNAGGLQVEVDGRSLGVMGRSGEVITRIPLDASYFIERLAATQ
jgi:cytoskeleton protein RodZ